MKSAIIKGITYLTGAALTTFTPIIDLLLFAGFLIALDFTTGIWASKKRGERIESRRMERTWAKIILYPAGIVFSHLAENIIPEIPFIKGAALLLIMIEATSLQENFSAILGIGLIKYIRVIITKGRQGIIDELKNPKPPTPPTL